jgi:hypothetical protein
MIEQIANLDGWTEHSSYFERAYSTGDPVFPVARVRFTPQYLASTLDGVINGTPLPIGISTAVSISLVNDDGSAKKVDEFLLVKACGSASYQQETEELFKPDDWLLATSQREIPKVIAWAKNLSAAVQLGLIRPQAPTVSTYTTVVPPSYAVTEITRDPPTSS